MDESPSAQNLRTNRLEQRLSARLVGNLASALDRSLPVPLGVQLRGLIEYGIACGELVPGTQLPSVRELADAGGIAPMTVSAVYKELRDAGLIVTRPGAGTFVARRSADAGYDAEALQRIERQMDALLREAEAAGLSAADVSALFSARAARSRARDARKIHVVMVGVFPEATQRYADEIGRQLRGIDSIDAVTINELRSGRTVPEPVDLYVTLANRRQEVEGIVGASAPVMTVSFIPAEKTRTSLAAIDPVARIGILSVFPEFLALMKPGVLRFTPHVQSVEVALTDDSDLPAFLQRVDGVVYATGSERAVEQRPAGVQVIEYRHVPDPHSVQRELLPAIERLRAGLPLRAVPA
jgi:DNA-binding transcriptional regulator YhcF (GntR family)